MAFHRLFAIPRLTGCFALAFLQLMALNDLSPAQDPRNPPVELPGGSCSDPGSRCIAITVEVTDKSLRPVAGLDAGDFKLFDNRQPQKIVAFHAVDPVHPSTAPLKVQIIIDAVNADAVLVASERDGVSGFLKQNCGKLAQPVSIWLLANNGLTRIAGPSQDCAELLTGLSGAQPLLRVLNRSAGVWGAVERTGQAIKLVKATVSAESATPGRKLVLFISPGWPMLLNFEPDQRRVVFNDIVNISNGLREAGISFYMLDPSSVGTTLDSGAYDNYLKGVTKAGDAQWANLSLQVISEHSGGQVISGNDIKDEIDTALRDAGTYYTLSFERASGSREGEYHNIHVTVDQPRVKIHTTAGYYLAGPG